MQTQPDPFLRRIQLRMAQARFVTLSALIHLAIIIMAGSVVLIKTIPEPPDFEAANGDGLFSADASSAQPPPVPPEDATPEFTPVQPQASAPMFQALTSVAKTASSFTMNASATALNLDDKLSKLTGTDGGKGMGEAVNRAMSGAGRMGGKGFFGSREKDVNALVGTFYDFKQTRSRKPTNIKPDEFHEEFRRFVREGWRESVLVDYYKGPVQIYATQFMIPNMSADEGPKAFGIEKEVEPSRWLVHYKGRVSPPADGTYYFVGGGDDILVVRLNGKIVLDRCWYKQEEAADLKQKNYDYHWTGIPNGLARGEPVNLRAAQAYDMEVLIGEQPGGKCFFALMVEKEGEKYEKDRYGNPILPPFRVQNTELPELERGQTFPPLMAEGPIWKIQSKGSGSSFNQFFK